MIATELASCWNDGKKLVKRGGRKRERGGREWKDEGIEIVSVGGGKGVRETERGGGDRERKELVMK